MEALTHETIREGVVRRYIFSQDHKIIGLQYLFTALFMALVGGALAMLMRLHLGWPQNGLLDPAQYLAAVTMHGTIMVLFFLTTLPSAFGNFLIPLMIGARDMAFPFVNMLSYWTLVPGVLSLLVSFFVPGGPAGSGWTAYPPLSALPQAAPGSGLGQTLWLVAVAFLCMSSLLGSLNFITTILNLRAPGMSMTRLPLTIWALLFTAIIALLVFPVLLAAGLMLLLDRVAGTSFFEPARLVVAGQVVPHAGGDPLLFQHLFWFFGHPEVYILIIPPLGIIADVLATFTRTPVFGYRAIVLGLAGVTGLSFLVWAHHMYVSGMHPLLGGAFMATTIAISVPFSVVLVCLIATLYQGQGRLRLATPLLWAIGMLSVMVTGGLTGLFLGDAPSDLYLHDTYWVVGHFHFTMALAALSGGFAGISYWFPKMFGRMLDERLGRIHFALTLPAMYATFIPMHFLGLRGMSRRLYDVTFYHFLSGAQPVDVFISLSAFVLGAAQLVFIANFFWSLVRGPRADRNPWRATTLEWTADSPPPHGNWPRIPVVHRWPYDYSLPGAPEDYLLQTVPTAASPRGGDSPA
jgi:cytochrome c oxidase subunit 1